MGKRRERRTWSDDEKCEICQQTMAPGVSVTQVARRYALNANMIHTWLKDPHFAPRELAPEDTSKAAQFIEVAVSSDVPVVVDGGSLPHDQTLSAMRVGIVLSDGRRILIEAPTSLPAVVGLMQGLTV